MKIHCPICSTGIDVEEAHAGNKGRCMNCESKFIIPVAADDPVEILERGEDLYCPICSTHIEAEGVEAGDKCRCMSCEAKFIIPENRNTAIEILERGKSSVQKDAPRMKVATSTSKATSTAKSGAKSPAKSGDEKELKVPVAGSGSMRTIVVHAPQKKGGGVMVWVVIVLAGAGIFGYMKFMEGGDENGAQAEIKAKPPVLKKVNVPSRPVVAPQPTEGEALDDSIPFDTSLADIGTFELTDKKKQRGLDFLKSGELITREAAYTAFRSLGDDYKDAYAELLGQARVHHLALLGKKAEKLSGGPQAPPDFENAHSAWKAAADAALEMIRTNWRTTAPDGYREKHQEMEGALEKARELHSALLPTLKGSGRQAMDSLQELAGVFTEFAVELAWCAGEDSAQTDITKLVAEARGSDGKEKEPESLLGRARVEFAASDAIGKMNNALNRGTAGYRNFAALLNERRVALGLKALRLEDTLIAASETHSGDMLFQNYFAHNSTDGSKPGVRAKAAGFTGRLTGACIYRTSPDVQAAYKAWWLTPGFRAAMYSSAPDVMGLGNAEAYWTLN
ncbi:MAG: hypothetical protein GY899_00355, partial [Verrucomicrobiaceae bacterium]|nr:hypothetical protein [Verrucomicrobiaceae bacterium]